MTKYKETSVDCGRLGSLLAGADLCELYQDVVGVGNSTSLQGTGRLINQTGTATLSSKICNSSHYCDHAGIMNN